MHRLLNSILLIAVLTAFVTVNPPSLKAVTPTYPLKMTFSFRDYTVRIYQGTDEDHMEILKSGRIVYEMSGYHLYVGYMYGDEEYGKYHKAVSAELIAMGRDITGRGVPNLVVSEWSGGAHCCLSFHIFEIGKEFRRIAVLDALDNDGAHFEKIGSDKRLVFVMYDLTTFSEFGDYWCDRDFKTPPASGIMLRYINGKYRLAIDLMRKPAPSSRKIASMIEEVQRNWPYGCSVPIPKRLWEIMLDLVYSGNAELAWQVFDRAWMPGTSGKEEALKAFRSELEKSPYWEEIKMLNWKR